MNNIIEEVSSENFSNEIPISIERSPEEIKALKKRNRIQALEATAFITVGALIGIGCSYFCYVKPTLFSKVSSVVVGSASGFVGNIIYSFNKYGK